MSRPNSEVSHLLDSTCSSDSDPASPDNSDTASTTSTSDSDEERSFIECYNEAKDWLCGDERDTTCAMADFQKALTLVSTVDSKLQDDYTIVVKCCISRTYVRMASLSKSEEGKGEYLEKALTNLPRSTSAACIYKWWFHRCKALVHSRLFEFKEARDCYGLAWESCPDEEKGRMLKYTEAVTEKWYWYIQEIEHKKCVADGVCLSKHEVKQRKFGTTLREEEREASILSYWRLNQQDFTEDDPMIILTCCFPGMPYIHNSRVTTLSRTAGLKVIKSSAMLKTSPGPSLHTMIEKAKEKPSHRVVVLGTCGNALLLSIHENEDKVNWIKTAQMTNVATNPDNPSMTTPENTIAFYHYENAAENVYGLEYKEVEEKILAMSKAEVFFRKGVEARLRQFSTQGASDDHGVNRVAIAATQSHELVSWFIASVKGNYEDKGQGYIYINYAFTTPKFKGKGIMGQLIDFFFKNDSVLSKHTVVVKKLHAKHTAIPSWESLGFTVDDDLSAPNPKMRGKDDKRSEMDKWNESIPGHDPSIPTHTYMINGLGELPSDPPAWIEENRKKKAGNEHKK